MIAVEKPLTLNSRTAVRKSNPDENSRARAIAKEMIKMKGDAPT